MDAFVRHSNVPFVFGRFLQATFRLVVFSEMWISGETYADRKWKECALAMHGVVFVSHVDNHVAHWEKCSSLAICEKRM